MRAFARFDSQVLRVSPLHQLPSVALDAALAQRLRAWCESALPFAVAPAPADAAQLEAFLRELDGDALLRRLSKPRGLLLRLRVKTQDLWPGRQRQAGDIWDCGYLSADAVAALADFRPRRPTLIVTDPMPEALLRQVQQCLAAIAVAQGPALRLLTQAAP